MNGIGNMVDVRTLLLQQMDYRIDDSDSWYVPLAAALEGVTARTASWRPNETFNSIWQLVNHLTFWTEFVSNRLGGASPTDQPIDNQATFGESGNADDEQEWCEAVSRLYVVYREFRERLEMATTDDMARALNSAGILAHTMIGGCLMHVAYHLGQIVLLRRLQGSWVVQK